MIQPCSEQATYMHPRPCAAKLCSAVLCCAVLCWLQLTLLCRVVLLPRSSVCLSVPLIFAPQVGFTKAAIFPLPEGVVGLFVKPNLMYLHGVDKHLVTNTAAAIRAVRKPNAYTGNGIQLVGETIKLKQRAGSK